MKEFICIDVKSNVSDHEVYEYVLRVFPEFKWHTGNSDMQGAYVSGVDVDDVQIQLWLGEKPIAMSISFRNVPLNIPEREDKKQALIRRVKENLIPSLGEIVKFDS